MTRKTRRQHLNDLSLSILPAATVMPSRPSSSDFSLPTARPRHSSDEDRDREAFHGWRRWKDGSHPDASVSPLANSLWPMEGCPGLLRNSSVDSSSPLLETKDIPKTFSDGSLTRFSKEAFHVVTSDGSETMDGEQERCLNTAFRISFGDFTRVKVKGTPVVIDGVLFLLVERTISGNDNDVYRKNKSVWENIPRGQVRVYASVQATPNNSPLTSPFQTGVSHVRHDSVDASTDHTTMNRGNCNGLQGPPLCSSSSATPCFRYLCSLSGLRKCGHWGHRLVKVFNANKEPPVSVFAVDKLDGESGNVMALCYNGIRYWVIGCLKKHIVVRMTVPLEDISAYKDETGLCASGDPCERTPLDLTRSIASAWQRMISAMPSEQLTALHTLMWQRRWTFCFDAFIPGWEHYIDLTQEVGAMPLQDVSPDNDSPAAAPFEGSESLKGTLVFYAITLDTPSESGLCLPVEEAMDVFHYFRLSSAECFGQLEIGSSELNCFLDNVAGRMGMAGAVFYGCNASGKVVCLWKWVCIPYHMERVVQESIITHHLHGEELEKRMQKKLTSSSKEDKPKILVWVIERLPFMKAFSTWLHNTKRLTASTDSKTARELRYHWLTTQKIFMDSVLGEPVVVPPPPSLREAGSSMELNGVAPDVIMLVGPQGCGKSTLARAVFALLQQAGYRPCWVNQDEIGQRVSYMAVIRRAQEGGEYTHIILDKMNLEKSTRAQYSFFKLRVVLTVTWSHPNGENALVDLCASRVLQRGASHHTFKGYMDAFDTETSSTGSNGETARQQTGLTCSDDAFCKVNAAAKSTRCCRQQEVRKVLLDCTSRYEAPTGGAILSLDVTMDFHVAVGRVWNQLCEMGRCELPSLDRLDMTDAHSVAFKYEDCLRHYPKATMAVLQVKDKAKVLELISDALMGEDVAAGKKKLLDTFQIVLHDFVQHPDPVATVRYTALVNREVTVRLKQVVADARITVAHVCIDDVDYLDCLPVGAGTTKLPPDGRLLSHPLGKRPPAMCADKDECRTHNGHEISLLMVVATAKKVHYRYAQELLHRIVECNTADPYCAVYSLPSEANAHFITCLHV